MYKGKLIVEPLGDGVFWEVKEMFSFKTPYHGWITIHPGFMTDFASIPKAFQWFEQPASGKHRRAAVCHDYLYFLKTGKRKAADDAFLYLMEHDGVPYFKRYAMYWAVRMGGGFRWKK